jgi:hypothetical protein
MKGLASKPQIAWQLIAAALTMGIFLLCLKPFLTYHSTWVAGATSIASSIGLIYTQPTCSSAKPYSMIVCYLLAFAIGVFLHWIASVILAIPISAYSYTLHQYLYDIMGMIAIVGILTASVFLRIPHPPAAGMALILTLRIDSWWLVLALFGCILILAAIRVLLRNTLVDLWV